MASRYVHQSHHVSVRGEGLERVSRDGMGTGTACLGGMEDTTHPFDNSPASLRKAFLLLFVGSGACLVAGVILLRLGAAESSPLPDGGGLLLLGGVGLGALAWSFAHESGDRAQIRKARALVVVGILATLLASQESIWQTIRPTLPPLATRSATSARASTPYAGR